MTGVVPERRLSDKGLGGKVLSMEERLASGDARMTKIEQNLHANTEATNEVLDIVRMGKSFFRVCGYIGNVIKWTLGLGAAIGAAWAAFKHGAN